MSRHRDVRNLEQNSESYISDDYGSSYGSSYADEVPLSASVEKYVYRRNQSGTSPKIGHFFMDRNASGESGPEEDGAGQGVGGDSDDEGRVGHHIGRRHPSVSSLLEGLTDGEQAQLARCLEHILDIVGDTFPEPTIKETIVRCEFDSDLAVNTLLNNPTSSTGAASTSTAGGGSRRRQLQQPQPTPWSPPAVPMQPGPPPMSVVLPKQQVAQVFLPDDGDDLPMDVAVTAATSTPVASKAKPAVLINGGELKTPVSAVKKGSRLKIRSRSPSPGGAMLAAACSTPSVPGSAVKMRKVKIDPTALYEAERGQSGQETAKDLLNLVVVGHVDSGKSTLMGHVLVELGQVSSRVMHKYESESKKLGKGSFAYAWVLDETSEERERGITMDVGHSSFQTSTKNVTLLDAPGHRDFIPNMISGAYQADVAILVVNATQDEFETGFGPGGQTREHALLVRSLGVSQLIVAVNKLDTAGWSEPRFTEISTKLGKFLRKEVGFKEADLQFVPVSGLTGANLASQDGAADWIAAREDVPTLIQAIDRLRPPPRAVDKAFRMSVSDIFKPGQGSGGGDVCVAGRIETGYIQKNDTILIAPLNETATVKSVSLDVGSSVGNNAFAGDHVSLSLSGADQTICKGMVLCDPTSPVRVSRHLAAKMVVFKMENMQPITKGFNCVMHHAGVTVAASIKKLVAHLSKSTGEVVKKKPRVLPENCSALVEITTDSLLCLETYSESKELGRFMLRVGGKTIAAGMITDIF